MDIDIDLPSTFEHVKCFRTAIQASMVNNGKLTKHPCGVYFQNIPKDPLTGLSAIPYQDAEDMGYTKIDFLHLTLLDGIESKQQIRDLLKRDPDWTMLRNPFIVEKLFHLSKWFDLVQVVSPTSIEQLADCLALIRPGKQRLIDQYVKNPIQTRKELYKQHPGEKYNFKKSHAIAYAMVIVLQLHILSQQNK